MVRAGARPGLSVPAISLARGGGQCWLTVNALVAPDDTVETLLVAIERRLAALRVAPLPLFDPAPAGTPVVRSVMPPAHYEEAVARAVQRIRAGELEKVVLAREVEVAAAADHDPGALFGVLRDAFAVLLRLRPRAGRRHVHRREPRAARAARGRPGEHGRAGRIDPPQRRSRGGRSPRRAAAALG